MKIVPSTLRRASKFVSLTLAGLAPVLVLLVLPSPAALAGSPGPNLLQNSNFETPVISAPFIRLANGTSSLPGWTVSGNGVELMRSYWQPENGSQSIDLSNFGSSAIAQAVTTTPGTKYLLSWFIAGNPSCRQTTVRVLSVLWNGAIVDTVSFQQANHTAASMGWVQDTIPETASGSTSFVGFARNVPGGACGVAIDNLSLQVQDQVTPTPSLAATPSSTPAPGNHPLGSPGSNHNAPGSPTRSTITSSLPTPVDAFGSLKNTLLSALIAVVAILLITFPAQLFNKTFNDHYDEIVSFWERRLPFLRPLRRKMQAGSDRVRSRTVVALVVLLGALLGGLLDPHFGFNAPSLTTYLAVVISTLWGISVSTGALFVYRRLRHRETTWSLRALPAGLAIALGCVLISRLTSFEPGYLYGVVCGAVFAGTLAKHEQGHAVAVSTLTTVVLAFLAWFAWVPINAAAAQAGAPMPLIVLDDFLGAVFTGGLIGSAIGMVPLSFLPGGTLAAWHRGVWATVAFVVTFAFIQIMLNPARGGHPGTAALGTVIALFVVFGGGSVLFAYHFAHKPNPGVEPALQKP